MVERLSSTVLSPSAVQARDRKLATLSETDKALDDLKRHRKELLDMLVGDGRVVHCSSPHAVGMLSVVTARTCCTCSCSAPSIMQHARIAKELQALQCLSGALSA